MTLAQYRYFRDVGFGGQVPTSEVSPGFGAGLRCAVARPPIWRCAPGCGRGVVDGAVT